MIIDVKGVATACQGKRAEPRVARRRCSMSGRGSWRLITDLGQQRLSQRPFVSKVHSPGPHGGADH